MNNNINLESNNVSGEVELNAGKAVEGDAGKSRFDSSIFSFLACEVLKTMNHSSAEDIPYSVVRVIQAETGYTDVCICLSKRDELSLFSSQGMINKSCAHKITEMTVAKSDIREGTPCRKTVECLYRLFVTGEIDDGEHITDFGTFWSNDLPQVLENRDICTQKCVDRISCFDNNFSSVALIPLKINSYISGSLIVADNKKGVFDDDCILFFEQLAQSVANIIALHENNAKLCKGIDEYQELLNDFSGFIIKLDSCKNVSFVSDGISQYFELEPVNITGLNIADVELFASTEELLKTLFLKKQLIINDQVQDFSAQTKKGEVVFQLKVITEVDKGGEVVAYRLVYKDITEYKALEKKLREKNMLLTKTLDVGSAGVIIVNAGTGKIMYSNDFARKFKAYYNSNTDDNESFGQYFSGLTVTDINDNPFEISVKFLIRNLLNTNRYCKHLKLATDSGGRMTINFKAIPVHNSKGNLLAGIVVIKDITDLVKVKTQRDELYQCISSLLELSVEAVLILKTSSGRVVEINKSFEKMFRLQRKDVIGKNIQDVNICSCNGIIKEIIVPVRNGTSLDNVGLKLKRNNNEEFEAMVSAKDVEHAGECCVLCMIRDVSRVIEMQEGLKQAEKMSALGQLVSGIAHDFNNQLTGILGYSDYLVSNLNDQELKKYAENIATCAVRSADLTEKLLAFSRKNDYIKEPIDIHSLLAEVVNMLERSIDKKISLESKLEAEHSILLGDSSQLQNVLLNLGINARDAISDDVGMISFITGSVELSQGFCEQSEFDIKPGKYISIKIKDTGVGMNDEIRSKIFDPFFTTKEAGKGTGMGLAAVYNTVKRHNGAIVVLSKIGQGSVFELLLPELLDDEVDSTVEATVKGEGKGHVLLADDEEIVRILGMQMLSDLGYDVTVCSNGREAVDIYREKKDEIDLVILDLIMPSMSGREAYLNLKKIDKDVKVVMTSGYTAGEEMSGIIEMGVMGVMKKPFYINDLANFVVSSINKQ